MAVSTISTEAIQGFLQAQKIIYVWPAWPDALIYMLGELLGRLRSYELVVLGSANIHQGPYFRRSIAWMKGSVVYRVAVDLTNVEVLLDFGNFGGFDSVGSAPDLFLRLVVVIC